MCMRTLVEEVFQNQLWQPPPPCKKTMDKWDTLLKIISGKMVHVRLFTTVHDQNTDRCDNSKGLIIYFHGNAEDLSTCNCFLEWLALHTGYNVLGLDYVGYGQSTRESTTELNMCEAADAVLEYATSSLEPKYKNHQICIIGRSLGSIPAVHLASNKNNAGLQGLVLISAFASAARCVLPSAYVPCMLQNSLDNVFGNNIQRIPEVHCMILLVHGDKDTTVGIENSEALRNTCKTWCHTKLVRIQGATHASLLNEYLPHVLPPLTQFLGDSSENARQSCCHQKSLSPYSYENLVEF